tara:strand:- start:1615 stop:2052 length:438 start_codon:yes stop_codon:yes gene_type:complete
MITFTQNTTRYTVKPENAQAYRALAAKPPKIKRPIDRKHDAMRRDYPTFYPGMDTSEYLTQYASLNDRLKMHLWAFNYADRAAPMLDATTPEVWEELDADYVPTIKRKPATTAQLRAALADLIQAIENGDPQTIANQAINASRLL